MPTVRSRHTRLFRTAMRWIGLVLCAGLPVSEGIGGRSESFSGARPIVQGHLTLLPGDSP